MAPTKQRTPKATPPVRVVPGADEQEVGDPILVEEPGGEAEGEGTNGAPVVGESVEELRAQLADETRRREAAEAAARAASNTVSSAQTTILDTQLQVIENALSKEDGVKKDIRSQLRAAKEAGDYEKEVELEDQLQQANNRIARLGEGKIEVSRQIEIVKETPADPVERYVQNLQPAAAAWVRSHPDYVTDDSKRGELESAHYDALKHRLTPGTPAYFEHVENELGLHGEREVDEPRTNTPAPAARPSRQMPSNSGRPAMALPPGVTQTGEGSYRMTPALREGARIAGMTDVEYLKHLFELHREGRLTH